MANNFNHSNWFYSGYSFVNIRCLFNILYCSHSNNPEVVLLLDAEKVFDRVKWNYFFQVLGKFVFGPINNVSLQRFKLQQGYLIFPLLFEIAIEPLAIALQVSGIFHAGIVQKVSLYAGDLLVFHLILFNSSNPFNSRIF